MKAKLYSNFVKSGTLTGGKMEMEEDGGGFVEDEVGMRVAMNFEISDQFIFRIFQKFELWLMMNWWKPVEEERPTSENLQLVKYFKTLYHACFLGVEDMAIKWMPKLLE